MFTGMKIILAFLIQIVTADYWHDRGNFLNEENTRMLGSSIVLTPQEDKANQILMSCKLQELDSGVQDPTQFNPAGHFFETRNDVEKSTVFKFIRKMPKGAALHAHEFSVVSQEYFMNLTYKENLYGCRVDGELHLKFLGNANQDAFCNWTSLTIMRQNEPEFDQNIRSGFFLNVKDRRAAYPQFNTIWEKMSKIMGKSGIFFAYREVFQQSFYQTLKELREDNVKYYEFRSPLLQIYDLNGTKYDPLEIPQLYLETLNQFKKDYPDFLGARLIYTLSRGRKGPMSIQRNHVIHTYFEVLNKLHETVPDFLAGFDIAGKEDLGTPLSDFVEYIKKVPSDIKRFFHASETNWFGATDLNLIDAVLLNTTRIGHGFAVVKHPLVMKIIKQRKIAIEVCPISNQVLMLVEDLRNHPAAPLMAAGYPIVISQDNNSLWGAKGLSYDFYMAFMGMTSRGADLRFLKQLALNSLEYSAMPFSEKERAIRLWNKEWNNFIEQVVKGF